MTGLFLSLLLAQTPLERELEAYRLTLLDWGGLTRYGSENSELKPDPNRVIFLGDEFTENGALLFEGKPSWLNRGITRQTAGQMLVRFRQDVIDLKPKVVVIQAGTNDVASVMGPSTEFTTAAYFQSMVDLAKLHGIRVVLATVPPVCDCAGVKQTARRSVVRLGNLNRWIREYAAAEKLVLLDLHAALVEGRALKAEYTTDGFLLTEAGYRRIQTAVEKAVGEAASR
jgi:lysophospholipase L1-like esterase